MAERYLVTGGSGFVGKRVIADLLERGYEVISLDSRPSGRSDIMEILSDITDPASISIPGSINGVIHCAGILESSHQSRDLLMKVNLEGTKNVYRTALKKGAKKFVLMSSIMAVGPKGRPEGPMNEGSEPGPDEPYGESKLLAERFLIERSRQDGVISSIIRPPVIYGEGMSPNSSAMRTFISVKKGVMPLIDGGTHVFNMLYVGNLSYGLVLSLDKNLETDIYHVNEGPYTLRYVIERISKRTNGKKGYLRIPKPIFYAACRGSEAIGHLIKGPPPLSMNKYRALTSDVWNMDHTKIRNELGYSPKYSLDEGIDRTCDFLGW